MRPTSARVLVSAGVLGFVLGLLVARAAYASLPPLSAVTPFALLLLAVFEGVLAGVVRSRVRGVPGRRGPMHPLQVARAAALAKASSPTGALLLGGYVGLLTHVLPIGSPVAERDSLYAALSAVGAFGLLVCALLLERACRTPDDPADLPGLGSRS